MEEISISMPEGSSEKNMLYGKSEGSSSDESGSTREGIWGVSTDDNDNKTIPSWSGNPKLLPTWSGNPQAPADRVQPTVGRTADRNFIAHMIFIAFALVSISSIFSGRMTSTKTSTKVIQLQENRHRMNERLVSTKETLKSLRQMMLTIDARLHDQDEKDFSVSNSAQNQETEIAQIQERLNNLAQLSGTLKKEVKQASLNHMKTVYGDSSPRVEVELVFPDRKVGPHKFTIELAPANVMPHSVDMFLRMVTAGLLDGCSFILNAMHVVKAAPLPYDGTSAAVKAKAFAAHGLQSVAFREYSKAYPHRQYTVGFAADGSPSFYINTEDNTDIHQGDPCFGKIVEGFDTIQRLEENPTRNGIWFERRIGIKSARVKI